MDGLENVIVSPALKFSVPELDSVPVFARVPLLFMTPLLAAVPELDMVAPEFMLMIPELVRLVTVTVNAAGTVTVIPLGMVTLSDGPGTAPPHVAGLFQFPFETAVNEVAKALWLENPVIVIIATANIER